MISVNSKTVNVSKNDLIGKLKVNLAQHKTDYLEAVEGYKIKLETELKDALKKAKNNTAADLVDMGLSVNCAVPPNYEDAYEEIIAMLEMSVDEVISLDNTSFKQYVMNEWSWSRAFNATATMYKTVAASVK